MTEQDMDIDDPAFPEGGWSSPDPLEDLNRPGPLFDGDTGVLPVELRRTMVSILKKRYISAEQHPSDWRILIDNEAQLTSRFHDLFLHLVIDRDRAVAYKRQAHPDSGTATFPTLLFGQAYTREETILLVKMRMLLRGSHPGDPVFVDSSELMDELASFRPPDTTNHVAAERTEKKAIEKLEQLNLLLPTAERDRFQVAPIIEALLSVARLGELIDWLVDARGHSAEPANSRHSDDDLEASDDDYDEEA